MVIHKMGPSKILIFGESGGTEDFNESVIQSVSEVAERERSLKECLL